MSTDDVHPDHDEAALRLRDAAATVLRLANVYMGRPGHQLSDVEKSELRRAADLVEQLAESLEAL